MSNKYRFSSSLYSRSLATAAGIFLLVGMSLAQSPTRSRPRTDDPPALDGETHPYGTVTDSGLTAAASTGVVAESVTFTHYISGQEAAYIRFGLEFYNFALRESDFSYGKGLSAAAEVELRKKFALQVAISPPSGKFSTVEALSVLEAYSKLGTLTEKQRIDAAQRGQDAAGFVLQAVPTDGTTLSHTQADEMLKVAKAVIDVPALQFYNELRRENLHKAGYFSARLGELMEPKAVFLYTSAFWSLPETLATKSIKDRVAYGLSGSVIDSINAGFGSGGDVLTSRVGASAAQGNPNSIFGAVSVGHYFNPSIEDVEVVASGLLASSRHLDNLKRVPSNSDPTNLLNSDRHLFDHVREGDWWADACYRVLGTDVKADAAEAGLTWGVPIHLGNPGYPNLCPTLSATVTYCEQKALELDEGAFELRVPITGILGYRPIFLSGRYGTRSDKTFSIQFLF